MVVSAACVDGDVYKALIKTFKNHNHDYEATKRSLAYDKVLKEKTRFYDYIEIQPLCNNAFLWREQIEGITKPEQLIELNKLMLALGETCKILVCATCDAHFLNKEGY